RSRGGTVSVVRGAVPAGLARLAGVERAGRPAPGAAPAAAAAPVAVRAGHGWRGRVRRGGDRAAAWLARRLVGPGRTVARADRGAAADGAGGGADRDRAPGPGRAGREPPAARCARAG